MTLKKSSILRLFPLFVFSITCLNAVAQKSYFRFNPVNPTFKTGENASLELQTQDGGYGAGSGYYLVSGNMPPGLAISDPSRPIWNHSRYITGVPNTTGSYAITIGIEFSEGGGFEYTNSTTITIVAGNQPFQNCMTAVQTVYSASLFDLKARMDADNMFVINAADNPTITWQSDDESVATINAYGEVTTLKAGETNITVSTQATANFLASTKTFKLTVTKAPLTLKLEHNEATYTGSPTGVTAALTGVVGNDNVPITYSYEGLGETDYGPSATPPTNAGEYMVIASVTENINYTRPGDVIKTLYIWKAPLTLLLGDAAEPYTGSAVAIEARLNGVVDDAEIPVTYSYLGIDGTTYGPTATPPTDTGTYAVTASSPGDANHEAPDDKTATLTISRSFDFEAIVKMRWNNTLTVINNPENNGGYMFETVTWYRNGIQVGTGQSWSAGPNGDTIDPADKFYVGVTSDQFEGRLYSTEMTIGLLNTRLVASHEVVGTDETLTLEVDADKELLDGAFIEMYNAKGSLVTRIKVEGRQTVVNLRPGAGDYMFRLRGKGGLCGEVRVEYK